MFQLLPVFLGLFDSTVQKLMNGFRDIFYELAYSNLSNMLSDLNEKVATISTELSTAPDAWQGGTIWELIVKIAEQVALPVAGTVFTFVVLWELISMLVQPNNLADIDFVSVLMKWLIKTIVAAWFISNALTICNCFFGIGASMVSKTTTVLNQQVTDNTQGSVLLKYLSDNYGDQDEDAESGDVSGLISLTVSTWFIDVIIKFMGILITIILYSRMISIYLHCAVAPLPMATVTNHHMSNIGIGYMKNVFALAMQAVLMMICVAIYGVLVANVFDPNTITLDPENGITAIKLLTKDFLASKEIENIFDNSDFVYMLNQGADDRDILAQKLDISQHQIKYVTNVGQGEGLIFFGDIVQPFVDRFPKDTLMYTLLTTKPAETKTETEAASEQAG